MKKSILSILLAMLVVVGCDNEESPQIQNADISMNSISDLESVPEGLQNLLSSPNGRTLNNNIVDMKEVQFLDDQNNEMSIIGMQLDNPYENMNQTLYYDETSESMSYLIEEVDLGNGIFQMNYLSPDGNYLFMQLEGVKNMMEITFTIDENIDPIALNGSAEGRIVGCGWSRWGKNFVGCLDRLWKTPTFKIVATASLFTGTGGYVAAGAVIGCGVGEAIPCLWNGYSSTSYDNCNSIAFCGRRNVPSLGGRTIGTVSFGSLGY